MYSSSLHADAGRAARLHHSPASDSSAASGEASGDSGAASEKLLGIVVETLPYYVAIIDPEGRTRYLNGAARECLGAGCRVGMPFLAAFPEEAGKHFLREQLPQAREHGRWQGTSTWRASDGRLLAVAQIVIAQPGDGSELQFLCIVARDISHRQAAEALLRERAALLEQAQEAVIVKSLDDIVLRWSAGAARIYGWTAEESIGRRASDLLRGDTGTYSQARRSTADIGRWTGELRKFNKQGSELIVDSRWTLIRDSLGTPSSILSIDADVTEQRKLQGQMLRAQRLDSIGTLAGGIAHDLNNVLAPITLGIGLLQMRSHDATTSATLTTMERSAARGADLVRQVLSFARGSEGNRVAVSPASLVRELQRIVEETFPKSITLEVRADEVPFTIMGNATQLHQVLLNLAVNARDAMPSGGRLTLEVETACLDVGYVAMRPDARLGQHVVFVVRDTGVGIATELLEKIFEPFFTTKDHGQGTGLGLSTVQSIVKAHGGFVDVSSELGKGTQFRVYLPAERDEKVVEPAAVPTGAPRGRGEHVLVVDDEEMVSSIMARTLEFYGYRVTRARNGAEAVARFVSSQPPIDIVLTDMAMPVMDGTATIMALGTIAPNVRVIGASGIASHDRFVSALGSRIGHFLQKPFTAETLLRALRTVLDKPAP